MIWESDKDGVASIVNDLLAEFHALPQLVKHDEWDYHLHATPSAAPVAARMAVEAAMAFVDVVRADELDRLRICGNFDCSAVSGGPVAEPVQEILRPELQRQPGGSEGLSLAMYRRGAS